MPFPPLVNSYYIIIWPGASDTLRCCFAARRRPPRRHARPRHHASWLFPLTAATVRLSPDRPPRRPSRYRTHAHQQRSRNAAGDYAPRFWRAPAAVAISMPDSAFCAIIRRCFLCRKIHAGVAAPPPSSPQLIDAIDDTPSAAACHFRLRCRAFRRYHTRSSPPARLPASRRIAGCLLYAALLAPQLSMSAAMLSAPHAITNRLIRHLLHIDTPRAPATPRPPPRPPSAVA